ncbi:MAG: RNA-binding protein [Nitrospirae bacterium]|nr:RNA-binding protein [Nitrospirota bacterium]MDA1303358.1 RNA-binding protein [Nitrospirota bacterium]
MGSKLYVGGLPFSVTTAQVESLFGEYGSVQSARVITDKVTGESRGFGFVEMSLPSEAEAAMAALHSSEMDGQKLTVNEAKPMPPRTMERGS